MAPKIQSNQDSRMSFDRLVQAGTDFAKGLGKVFIKGEKGSKTVKPTEEEVSSPAYKHLSEAVKALKETGRSMEQKIQFLRLKGLEKKVECLLGHNVYKILPTLWTGSRAFQHVLGLLTKAPNIPQTVEALEKMGPEAEKAIPALIKALKE